ncbi:hypothetical protein C8Q77DRAFT_259822 [Trametes polyzona]|nr:hypothetical protein C8Q77DRAFT_259822 [Trametes polyzona]
MEEGVLPLSMTVLDIPPADSCDLSRSGRRSPQPPSIASPSTILLVAKNLSRLQVGPSRRARPQFPCIRRSTLSHALVSVKLWTGEAHTQAGHRAHSPKYSPISMRCESQASSRSWRQDHSPTRRSSLAVLLPIPCTACCTYLTGNATEVPDFGYRRRPCTSPEHQCRCGVCGTEPRGEVLDFNADSCIQTRNQNVPSIRIETRA